MLHNRRLPIMVGLLRCVRSANVQQVPIHSPVVASKYCSYVTVSPGHMLYPHGIIEISVLEMARHCSLFRGCPNYLLAHMIHFLVCPAATVCKSLGGG